MRVCAKFSWDLVSPGPQTSPGLRDKSTSISLSRFARIIFFSTALQLFFFVSRIGKWLNQILPVLAIIFIAIFWLTGIIVSYVFPQYQHHCWTVACENLEKNFNLWCVYILPYRKFSALFRMNKNVRRHTWKWFAAVCAQGCDRCQQGWCDWEKMCKSANEQYTADDISIFSMADYHLLRKIFFRG